MSNYEPFFSLQRPLFDSNGDRSFVYESDQLKSAADAFKVAFSKPAPVLCVSGQHGCGKSSTVNFALNQLGEKTRRISVGRVRLSEDEVIDLLLEKLDVDDAAGGTIKKLGRFTKRIEELRVGGERVVVIVEDAIRTGANILSELEVLCGGDGGADVGLIICGDENLRALLKTPELAPLSQRMNDFVRLAPFAVDELEDYLRHAVSEAGGDYDSIFGKDYAGLTHILSCGVPRVANKLTEASLAAAAKAGQRRVSCALLADIARSRFDIETELPVYRKAPEVPKREPIVAAPAAPEIAPEPAPKEAAADPRSRQIPDVTALTGSRAPIVTDVHSEAADVEIPHLIQDTQPELKALTANFDVADHADETDSSGAFVSLPNLEDLTAEFAAVSQMIESLPTSRYEEDEENTEIEDAFSDFGMLDKALQPAQADQPENVPEETPTVDATSTALPKLSVPQDPTLNEASLDNIDASAPQVPTLRPASEKPPEVMEDPAPLASNASTPEMPVLEVELPELAPEEPAPMQDTAETRGGPERMNAESKADPASTQSAETESAVKSEIAPAKVEAAIEAVELNDWDRDPTLAELRPDLDALELAMGEDIELASEPDPRPVVKPEPKVVLKPAAMPEITLDNSIQEKVEQAAAESSEQAQAIEAKRSGTPSDTEVHRMMEDLSNASSLEDMDDRLAETLFGDEINLVASQVLKAARESMDKKTSETPLELSLESTAENLVPTATPAAKPASSEKANATPDQYPEDEGEVIDLKSMRPNSGLDMSASQRLRTVRALNAGMGAATPPSLQKQKTAAAPKEKPVPIEDQIDLSMTATFKALKIDPSALQQEEEETEKKGFFSRFRNKG